MNKILNIKDIAPRVKEYVIENPDIARHCLPGQFIILRVDENGERVPFTICDFDREKGTITLLVQEVGYSTHKMAMLKVGDSLHDMVGPLGNATELDAYENVVLVGGGIGCAVIYPQAKLRTKKGQKCDVIMGARTKELLFNIDEFRANSDNTYIATDDGSMGTKGFVTTVLQQLIDEGKKIDCVFVVGPMIMMRNVSELTRKYNIPTIVSMNCVMVDGTGMCGGCRLTVGGETKYACVDGPEFDGHKVDFAEAMNRAGFYKEHEEKCRLRG
ncbi:MAG: sulfide/dihydroorotate dehydrogenase-like FAD/NAD-binding protein [Eubacteriales bacterium]|nr:sulfide/dihydroorotate dehydrogenase-like FAD/NAD-binding protein [Eubacteriales bacterium]